MRKSSALVPEVGKKEDIMMIVQDREKERRIVRGEIGIIVRRRRGRSSERIRRIKSRGGKRSSTSQ